MSLYLKFMENIENFEQLVFDDVKTRNGRVKSIERLEARFRVFWDTFKIAIEEGGHNFNFVVDSDNHLSHIMAMSKLAETIEPTMTVETHEDIISIFREMREEGISFRVVSRSGGLLYIQFLPEEKLYEEYVLSELLIEPEEPEEPEEPHLMDEDNI